MEIIEILKAGLDAFVKQEVAEGRLVGPGILRQGRTWDPSAWMPLALPVELKSSDLGGVADNDGRSMTIDLAHDVFPAEVRISESSNHGIQVAFRHKFHADISRILESSPGLQHSQSPLTPQRTTVVLPSSLLALANTRIKLIFTGHSDVCVQVQDSRDRLLFGVLLDDVVQTPSGRSL
jgi:hypothetical protein